jgi:hypothetical protein
MEQRRLRLGDILDDYCPRERRVTNHAVVAMVEEDVKQTRCTTCDAEHVYKGGKAPRRKKTETTGKLYKQVLAGLTDQDTAAAGALADPMDDPDQDQAGEPIEPAAELVSHADASHDDIGHNQHAASEDPQDAGDEPEPIERDEVDGPVHRPLIRAQLPRIEGLKVERQAPDFTIRQTAGRGGGGNGHFRGGNNNNGQRFGRGPHRGGRGGGQGFGRGPGGNQQRHGGGRKRGR